MTLIVVLMKKPKNEFFNPNVYLKMYQQRFKTWALFSQMKFFISQTF